MGKGNFILGTGSSSIGDVTFARRNGQQIARVRVRKINNPRSYGQAEQRMISSMVAKFYAPLSGVLETSFEGLSKMDSYAKFLSVNMNLARANQWGAPKGTYLPFPFQVANGTVPTLPTDSSALEVGTPAESETVDTLGKLSALLLSTSDFLQNGDQITVIGWVPKKDGTVGVHFDRFFIDTESTQAIPAYLEYRAQLGLARYTKAPEIAAWIASRWDGSKWLRSNAFVDSGNYLETWTADGKYDAAVRTFMNGGGRTPISDVYLNGDDGQ